MPRFSTTNDAAQNHATLVALQEAVRLVRSRSNYQPAVAIILGSGLGGLADEIQDAVAIDYHDIPGSHAQRPVDIAAN